jgi:hypothetical protein
MVRCPRRLRRPKQALVGFVSTLSICTFATMVGAAPANSPLAVSTVGVHGSKALTGKFAAAAFQGDTTIPVQRIYGADAIGTSIAVSQAEYPSADSANAVVLARSDFFADALAGGPLAAKLGGPLLITPGTPVSSSIDSRVANEIQRVLPSGNTVYILGGPLALSTNIDGALQALGYVTQRIAGADEFATAVDIADQLGNPSTVFEATGLGFQDALSSVPAAIATAGAILLTDGSAQAPETAAYLAAHPGGTRYAIGGPLAAAGADPSATPVWGEDLYGTSAAVASTFFSGATAFGAATGTNFPDALSGGVLMGGQETRGPMLLVRPSGPLPPTISKYLVGSMSTVTQGFLFGGPLAVGNDVLSELETPQSTIQTQTKTSSNWSGYIVTAGPYSEAAGTFTVPQLTSYVPNSATAEWVGIDGYGNESLIQAGVAEAWVTPTQVVVWAWWEILPAAATPIETMTVNPGDVVSIAITQVSGSEWAIAVIDQPPSGPRESFTTQQAYDGQDASAEWIVEAPTDAARQVVDPLAPYSPDVTFSQLTATGTEATLTDVIMVQANEQVSTPSPMSSSGFAVAYGSTAPPAP